MTMRKNILLLLAVLLLAPLSAELIDRIVGKVGNDIILMSDVYKLMQQMQSAGLPQDQISAMTALQQLIEQKIIFQKAKDLDIKVDEGRIAKMAERYLQQIKSRYASEAAFIADLANEKLTEQDLLDYYKSMLMENAMSDQLVDRYVTSQISVSEEEIRQFYDSSKDSLAVKPVTWELGLIMHEIKPSAETEAATLAEIRQLQNRLIRGEDFALLATQFSDCPSKERGGDLGFFGRGMMVKPFEDAAFALNVGEVSDVVRTQYGFHLIKVEEKRTNEIRARHILKILSPTGADSLAARQALETARESYLSGTATFSELAREFSQDAGADSTGGSIGEFSTEEFPELFSAQIAALPTGGITPVLENEGILYLFAKLREIPSRLYDYEEVKDKVKTFLFNQKQTAAYEEWIGKLIAESYVQIVE